MNFMRNISVSLFINLLFGLVITLLITVLFLFISINKSQQEEKAGKRYRQISNFLLSTATLNRTREDLENFYTTFNLRPVSNNERQLLGITHGKTIFKSNSLYGRLEIIKLSKNKYISLQRYGGFNLIVQDKESYNTNLNNIIIATILIMILFSFLYIGIYRKLAPLKKLNRQIEAFSEGNMNIKITQKADDEIGKIAQNFDNALHHIRTLLESKNLFMRNMMHELKTPITRGRIAIEMVEDGSTKEVLVRAFERMNELIAELAHVERLTTQDFHPQIQEININEVIDESISLLLCERSSIGIETKNELIRTDQKLLTLAIKNLLENGLKYSEDDKTTIVTEPLSIKVFSKGKSLEYPLSYYLEPFTQEEKRNAGFGLGLYIVNNIAKRLHYTLLYYHKSGSNIFELKKEMKESLK